MQGAAREVLSGMANWGKMPEQTGHYSRRDCWTRMLRHSAAVEFRNMWYQCACRLARASFGPSISDTRQGRRLERTKSVQAWARIKTNVDIPGSGS
jgi:hypothetical protein